MDNRYASTAAVLQEADRVLLVDDEASALVDGLRSYFATQGLELDIEVDPARAIQRIRDSVPAAVILDIMFPSPSGPAALGVDLLRQVKSAKGMPPVMMLTAAKFDEHDDLVADALAIADFVFRKAPASLSTLAAMREWGTDFAKSVRRLVDANRTPLDLDRTLGFYVGSSRAMLRVAREALRLAPTRLSVLILGEPGTGKERLARAIHTLSGRHGRFETRNCGAFPSEDLMKADLFGHTKGAYTGAREDRLGLFEAANSGTIFLDEIQALSVAAQQALLRVLQESKIKRVGEHVERPVDVRMLSATNGDIALMLERGELRVDFLERLNGAVLRLPPLRERRDDVLPLVRMFLETHRPLNPQVRVSDEIVPSVERVLTEYHWPGNIRELENSVKRAIATANSNVLMPWQFDDLGGVRRPGTGTSPTAAAFASFAAGSEPVGLPDDLRLPAPSDMTMTETSVSPGHDRARSSLTWQELRQYRGDKRREVLLSFIQDVVSLQGGRPPDGNDLARRLGISRSHFGQILLRCEVRLRDLKQNGPQP